MTPSRRRFLQLSGASLAGLAGCAGVLDSGPEPVELTRISALNFHTERHRVNIQIQRPDTDDPYFKRYMDVPPGAPDEPVSAEPPDMGLSDVPEEVTDGVFTAWRDDQAPEDGDTFDFATYGPADCVGLEVHLGSYGADPPSERVSIWHTSNCNDGN
jgi:hypothetical protein